GGRPRRTARRHGDRRLPVPPGARRDRLDARLAAGRRAGRAAPRARRRRRRRREPREEPRLARLDAHPVLPGGDGGHPAERPHRARLRAGDRASDARRVRGGTRDLPPRLSERPQAPPRARAAEGGEGPGPPDGRLPGGGSRGGRAAAAAAVRDALRLEPPRDTLPARPCGRGGAPAREDDLARGAARVPARGAPLAPGAVRPERDLRRRGAGDHGGHDGRGERGRRREGDMTLPDIEVSLEPEEQALRDTARRFAAETLRPIGAALDRLSDPEDVIAPGSPLWAAFDRYRALGLAMLEDLSPAGEVSLLQQARLRFLVSEELGWGDTGLAISLGVSGFPSFFARLTGRPALVERFCAPGAREIGCWAITEPDHGSDQLAVADGAVDTRAMRPNCVARRDGDGWVIDGQKAAWVSNGTIATVAALFCTVDPSRGLRGGGVALVPLDLPGVARGRPLDKLGQRALNQGEIFFDGVRIPEDYLVVGPDDYAAVVEAVLTIANASMGA